MFVRYSVGIQGVSFCIYLLLFVVNEITGHMFDNAGLEKND